MLSLEFWHDVKQLRRARYYAVIIQFAINIIPLVVFRLGGISEIGWWQWAIHISAAIICSAIMVHSFNREIRSQKQRVINILSTE
jgi:hypothetical protein